MAAAAGGARLGRKRPDECGRRARMAPGPHDPRLWGHAGSQRAGRHPKGRLRGGRPQAGRRASGASVSAADVSDVNGKACRHVAQVQTRQAGQQAGQASICLRLHALLRGAETAHQPLSTVFRMLVVLLTCNCRGRPLQARAPVVPQTCR